jgi:molecular chaperone GrpE (heat shock protein)
MDRERRDLAEYTAGEAIKDLLPIIDNLERALQARRRTIRCARASS